MIREKLKNILCVEAIKLKKFIYRQNIFINKFNLLSMK